MSEKKVFGRGTRPKAQELDELRNEINELRASETPKYSAFTRTNEQLYASVARAYLLWRAASEKPDFLESLYRERGIVFHRTGNRPNFTPFFRLIWSIDQ